LYKYATLMCLNYPNTLIHIVYTIAIAPKRRAATPNKFELMVDALFPLVEVLVAAAAAELSVE